MFGSSLDGYRYLQLYHGLYRRVTFAFTKKNPVNCTERYKLNNGRSLE